MAQSSRGTITENGIRLLLAMYNAPQKEKFIDSHRYYSFVRATRLNKPVKLSNLPPTFYASQQHIFRVYLQVQKWLDNDLNPEEWGWMIVNNSLEPIQTLLPPAPDLLLNTIFCNCTKGCSASCSCRKIGLRCSAVCGHCRGQSCLNVETEVTESDMDVYDDIDPMTCLIQEMEEIIDEEHIEEITEEDEEAPKEIDVEEETE